MKKIMSMFANGARIYLDKYIPDHSEKCVGCGEQPSVTAVKDGKTVWESDKCGLCLWGSPYFSHEDWNKSYF